MNSKIYRILGTVLMTVLIINCGGGGGGGGGAGGALGGGGGSSSSSSSSSGGLSGLVSFGAACANCTVTYKGEDGTTTGTTTTDQTGSFSLSGLVIQNYLVTSTSLNGDSLATLITAEEMGASTSASINPATTLVAASVLNTSNFTSVTVNDIGTASTTSKTSAETTVKNALSGVLTQLGVNAATLDFDAINVANSTGADQIFDAVDMSVNSGAGTFAIVNKSTNATINGNVNTIANLAANAVDSTGVVTYAGAATAILNKLNEVNFASGAKPANLNSYVHSSFLHNGLNKAGIEAQWLTGNTSGLRIYPLSWGENFDGVDVAEASFEISVNGIREVMWTKMKKEAGVWKIYGNRNSKKYEIFTGARLKETKTYTGSVTSSSLLGVMLSQSETDYTGLTHATVSLNGTTLPGRISFNGSTAWFDANSDGVVDAGEEDMVAVASNTLASVNNTYMVFTVTPYNGGAAGSTYKFMARKLASAPASFDGFSSLTTVGFCSHVGGEGYTFNLASPRFFEKVSLNFFDQGGSVIVGAAKKYSDASYSRSSTTWATGLNAQSGVHRRNIKFDLVSDFAIRTRFEMDCQKYDALIGGTISGLAGGASVVLASNGQTVTRGANGAYTFANRIGSAVSYAVTVQTQPNGQTCTVANATGSITSADISNIDVTCTSGNYTIGGSISGLQGTVVLQNNAGDNLSRAQNGAFVFATAIAHGANYAVTVSGQPTGQTCNVSTGSGAVNGANVSNVAVACTNNNYQLSGSISGLGGGKSLQLTVGGVNQTFNANGNYAVFNVAYSAAYTVSVTTQPAGQNCTVANATGTMGAAHVTNANVTCTNITHTIGGSISGLGGTVVLQNNGGDDLSRNANGNFTFATAINSGTNYNVTVLTQPTGQTCNASTNAGTANANITNVGVNCSNNNYQLSGSISGLGGGKSLQLTLGGVNQTFNANGAYNAFTVAYSANYSVSVTTQPAGQNCTVANNAGTMGAGNVTNVNVTCQDLTYTIGGNLSGASGAVGLRLNGGNDLSVNANGAFTFGPGLTTGTAYTVTIQSAPAGNLCTLSNATGNMGSANITNVGVSCQPGRTISGSVTGLGGATGLQLTGGGQSLIVNADGAYQMPGLFADTTAINMGLQNIPAGLTCSYNTASFTVNGANVSNINVSCQVQATGQNVTVTNFPAGTDKVHILNAGCTQDGSDRSFNLTNGSASMDLSSFAAGNYNILFYKNTDIANTKRSKPVRISLISGQKRIDQVDAGNVDPANLSLDVSAWNSGNCAAFGGGGSTMFDLTLTNRGTRNVVMIFGAAQACTAANNPKQYIVDGGNAVHIDKNQLTGGGTYKVLITQQDQNNQAAFASQAISITLVLSNDKAQFDWGNLTGVTSGGSLNIANLTNEDTCNNAGLAYIAAPPPPQNNFQLTLNNRGTRNVLMFWPSNQSCTANPAPIIQAVINGSNQFVIPSANFANNTTYKFLITTQDQANQANFAAHAISFTGQTNADKTQFVSFSNLTNQNFSNFTADAATITNADSCGNAGLAYIAAPPPQANLTFNNRGAANRVYIWNAGAACTSGNLVLQAQLDGTGKATFNKSTLGANNSYKILVAQQDVNNQGAWATSAKSYNATVDAGGNVMNVGTQNNVQIDNATIDLNQASQGACDPGALTYIAP